MRQLTNKDSKGVTLLELLLVMVIVGAMMAMGIGYIQQQTDSIRIDKTTAQMQQILNAGLAYYVNNGAWPPAPALTCLQGSGACSVQYVPANLNSPIPGASIYTAAPDSTGTLFSVSVTLPATTASSTATAQIIAGKLPLSNTTGGTVISYVNIPGQNLNNASAVNFAGLYHHGGCIPVPVCPMTPGNVPMTPEVMVVPISVSGLNDPGTTNIYPISSFSAYAVGGPGKGDSPAPCSTGSTDTPACSEGVSTATVTDYWRACLQVITEKGDVENNPGTGTTSWGQYVTLMAITRCIIPNEVSGSPTTVYSN